MAIVYIGYDDREWRGYAATAGSILQYAPNTQVVPLKQKVLRDSGVFTRPHMVTAKGQFIDAMDGKPMSTQFSFTRFLVPMLARKAGHDTAVFVDSDFLFFADINELIAQHDPSNAVSVVQHHYQPSGTVKMDGMAQEPYPRKNWSSLMVFSATAPENIWLTPTVVNNTSGRDLHALKWAGDAVGALEPGWNWLVGEQPKPKNLKAAHYTLGTPDMPGYGNSPYALEWWATVMQYAPVVAMEGRDD